MRVHLWSSAFALVFAVVWAALSTFLFCCLTAVVHHDGQAAIAVRTALAVGLGWSW